MLPRSWAVIAASCVVGILAAGLYLASEQVLRPSEYRPGSAGELPAIAPSSRLWTHYQGLVSDPLTDLGIPYEPVEFPAVDGSRLRGWVVPAAAPSSTAIVTVHGAWFDRRDFLRRLPMLHGAGYPVLMFDCREHGISAGSRRGPGLGQREREDVSAAARFMKEWSGSGTLVVLGQSQGAVSALLAASSDPAIDAVIAENPFATLRSRDFPPPGMSALPWWVARVLTAVIEWRAGVRDPVYPVDVVHLISPRSVLFMHGSADEVVPEAHSRLLYERAREPKELWIAPGAGHDALINADPAEYKRRVLSFVRRAVDRSRVAD